MEAHSVSYERGMIQLVVLFDSCVESELHVFKPSGGAMLFVGAQSPSESAQFLLTMSEK